MRPLRTCPRKNSDTKYENIRRVFVSMETEKVYFWVHRGQHRKGKQCKVLYAEKSEKFTFPAFRNIQNVKFISLICRKKR